MTVNILIKDSKQSIATPLKTSCIKADYQSYLSLDHYMITNIEVTFNHFYYTLKNVSKIKEIYE